MMTKQTALLDLSVLQASQPFIFQVFRRQTGAAPAVESVSVIRYLMACFPALSEKDIMQAVAAYSEFSLVTPIRKPTKESIREDQKDEIHRIFSLLDKEKTGVLPVSALCTNPEDEVEVASTKAMLQRLHISEINKDAFVQLVAPYLMEFRRKKRFRVFKN
jgi:Ca2+-binding EF-hand superfamily protein